MWKLALITVVSLAITLQTTLAESSKKVCPKNELLDQCPASCPPRTCATKDIQFKCVAPLEVGDPKCPAPKCRCEDGFYRNDSGNCVTKEQCDSTPKCPKNELLDQCPASCPPRTCATKDIQVKCVAPLEVGDPKCPAPKCRCEDGFYRNDSGNCVTKKQCGSTPVCPQNEEYDFCPNPCPPRNCSTSDIQFNCLAGPTYPDPACPTPVCRCSDGFFRNDQGSCVTKAECNNCVKPNEVWDSCAPSSPPQTCDYLNGYTKPQSKPSKSKCNAECRCQEGYFRNYLEDCITKEHCLECSGPNEFWSCGGACDNVCENLSTQNRTTCPIMNIKCNEMCYCKDGYARDSKGICVPFAKCNTKCPKNELLDQCPASCPPRTCATKDIQVKCVAPLEVGDPKCPAPKCRCEDGFYRNDSGNCVTKKQCGSTPVCPQNEEYDFCPNPCPPRNCSTSDIQFNCLAGPTYPDPACPTPVCRCSDGFFRNDQGSCVTKAECNNCVKPNEVWDSCAPSSPPQTCDYLNGYTKPQSKPSKSKCNAECRCQEGYFRNYLEDCITKEHCLECSGPNEFWSCGGACDNVCENLSTQNRTTCPIMNIKCNEMCYCKDGYARDSKGICVPFAKCNTQKGAHSRTYRATTAVQCSSEDVQAGTSNFAIGNAQFSANFYSVLSKEQSNQSTISSPYSLLFLLAQLVLYTTGVSYDQLIAALGLQDKDQVRCTFPALINAIASQTDVTFDLATKVYSNVGNPLSESYKSDSKDVFKSEAETLDFSQSEQAAQTINSWVAENTNNKINDLIPASALNAMTRLVLVNALYFNGLWQKSFNKNATRDSPFYVSSTQTKNVPTMTQKNYFFYTDSDALDCQILSMPYTGGKFSFVIFLPNEQDGLAALQDKMKNVTAVKAAVSSATNVSITVYIPKFTITTTIDLTQLLSKIGITQIFNQTDSGISGFLQNPEAVYVSAAIQKAFIDVSESGTEAAAANAIVGVTSASSGLIQRVFYANHPFVYQLRFENSVIFTGSYWGS